MKNIDINKTKHKIKVKENNNEIVMLLDNAFEPDIRVYKEARYLVNKGYRVEIICLDKKNKYKDKATEKYDGINIRRFFCRTEKMTELIEKYNIISKLKSVIYFWWLLKFIAKIKKYLENRDFEILHCHDLIMTFIGVLFFKDKKIVFDMHEYYLNKKSKFQNWFIKKIVKYIQKKAMKIIYVNEFQIKDVKYKEKLIYLPNYPEKNKFLKFSHIESLYLRISYTGYVRHYIPLLNLMKAVDKLKDVKLTINGSGDAYEPLMEQSKKLKNTTLTGPYKHDDIAKFYENTDLIYIVYNKGNKNDETAFPTKFFEAIITETPMLVLKDSAMGKFVEENNIGFTVDGTDSVSIEKVIKQIKDNPDLLEEKRKNINKIASEYSWEEVVNNLKEIYE